MGNPAVDATCPIHFYQGDPSSWALGLHYGDAGIAVGASQITQYDFSPEEPVASLLTDLGPIAMQDYSLQLGGAAAGAYLHSQIASRPGAWFDWYRAMVDPQLRTAAQQVEIQAGVRDALLHGVRGCV